MKSKNTDALQAARNYAFLLLKFRPRSEKEIQQRLRRKKFSQDDISQTLAFLKEKNFINDVFFAKAWIESRIKKPLGLRRLRKELELKGIDAEVISAQIEEIRGKYPEGSLVPDIVREKWGRLKSIEPEKAKRRIYAYLLRRGFSPQIVKDTINDLCTPPFLKSRGADMKGRAGCKQTSSEINS